MATPGWERAQRAQRLSRSVVDARAGASNSGAKHFAGSDAMLRQRGSTMSQIATTKRAGPIMIACAIAFACTFAITQPAGAAALIYGYAYTKKHLVSFFSDAPGSLVGDVALTGLGTSEFLAGLDFRPATGALYSVAVDETMVRAVTVDTATGAVTAVGAPQPTPFGSPYGLDFDPVVDRLRFVGAAGTIDDIDPDSGVMVVLEGLLYAGGGIPLLAHIAYTNSFAGATTTMLYGIDSTLDALVVVDESSPNEGSVTTVGTLGHGMAGLGGFDIEPGTNTAYAALQRGVDYSSLYTVDLTTGQATEVGPIGGGRLAGIAIAPEPGAFASTLCAITLLGWLGSRRLR